MSLCFDRSDHRWRLGSVVRSGGSRRLLCFPLTCSKHYRCFVQMLVLCPFQNTPSTNIKEQPKYKTTQALRGNSWRNRADREWNLVPPPVIFFLIISRDTKTQVWRTNQITKKFLNCVLIFFSESVIQTDRICIFTLGYSGVFTLVTEEQRADNQNKHGRT